MAFPSGSCGIIKGSGKHVMNKLSLLLVPLLAVAIAIPAQGAAPQ